MTLPNNRNNQLAFIVLIALFASIIIFRIVNLSADTPFGISTGQELSTDPPQYTSFARNQALFGNWEIYYTRYVFFVNNITTLMAYPIFKIFGTGRAQSNSVATLFSLLTIFASFLIWRKKGYPFAIASTAILGFNYIFISYGKMTFLEVTTLGVASFAGFLLLCEKYRILTSFLSGILFAAAAFYSKLLAVVFLPLALVILLIELYQMKKPAIFKKFNPLYAFGIGYVVIFLLWLVTVYLPSRGEVSGYLSEISTGMYGAPKAFESVKMFFVQLFSYGFDSKLWAKQPITFAIGFLGAAAVAGFLFSPKKEILHKIDRIDLFNLLWFVGIFCTLFPWNYRPLRYALLIFPPMCYLATRWLFILSEPRNKWGKRIWPLYLFSLMAGAIVVFHLLINPHFEERSLELILKYIPFGILFGVLISLIAYIIHRFGLKDKIAQENTWSVGKVLASVILIGIIIIQVQYYFANSFKEQETIHNASIDLGKILAPNAVVVGSYSSALTQDNQFRSVIKMFGVPVVEKDFFLKVPATHVAIEAGGGEGSNESRALKDYPDIMKNAPIVATYYLRGYPVNVYLISETSPNPAVISYKPSLYEQAAIYQAAGKTDSAMANLAIFEKTAGETISGDLLRTKIYMAQGMYQDAQLYLEKLAAFDKGNLNIWWMLGDVYLKSNPPIINKAYEAYKRALYLRPDDKSIKYQLNLLDKYLH
jgi:hypothetical protein